MSSPCPSLLDLEAAAARDITPEAILQHTQSCEPCRRKLEDMTANNRFLQQLRPQLSARTTDTPTLGPGVVHGFELLEEISRGGQGVVYRALQSATKRPAAVKMLLGGALASDRQQARFHREIEIAARLRHPGIVSVFESGVTTDGRQFVAMEYVEGEPLDLYLRRHWPLETSNGRARTAAILRLIASVASAAGHAHAAGVIHRDLKPSNILVDASGAPRILDFGLARADDSSRDVSVTQEFVGTLGYAAPEQLSGQPGAATSRTDVYALGVLLYASLTERHPYSCEGPFVDIARHVLSTEPAPPSTLLPRLPYDIDTIVLKALAKDPARRYQSAGALAADIEDHLAGRPISARRDSTMYVLSKLARKHRVPAAAAAVILLTIIGALIGLAMLAANLDHERQVAVAALSDSAIHRARLLGAAGEIVNAERILWTEALAAGLNPDEPSLGIHESPQVRRSAWALAEFYARVPRLMRVHNHASIASVAIEDSGEAVRAVAADGSIARWRIDGEQLDRSPSGAVRGADVFATPIGTKSPDRIVLWENESLRVVEVGARRTIAGPIPGFPPVPRCDITIDGSRIAIVDHKGELTLRDGNARVLAVLATGVAEARNPVFSSDGAFLLAPFLNETGAEIRVWRLADLAIVRRCRIPPEALLATHAPVRGVVGAAGAASVAAIVSGAVAVWRDDDQAKLILSGISAQPSIISFNDDESRFSIADHEGRVHVWSLLDFSPGVTIENGARVFGMQRRESLGLVVIGDVERRVSVFETEHTAWLKRMPTRGFPVHTVSVASDGSAAFWGDDRGAIGCIGLDGSTRPPPRLVSDEMIGAVEELHEGRQVLVAGIDGVVAIHNAEDGAPARRLLDADDAFWTAAATADGRVLAVAGTSGDIYIWPNGPDAPHVVIAGAHSNRVTSITLTQDGSRLASTSVDRTVAVWRTVDQKLLCRPRAPDFAFIRAAAWSPDGSLLVTGGDDRAIRVWNPETGEQIRSIEGLGRSIFDLNFHPFGRVLFAATRSPDLLVIDPHAGAHLASIRAHDKLLFAVEVTPDGRKLITAGEDPWIGVWDLDHMFRYIKGNADFWREELR